MERKCVTCPETGHLAQIDVEQTVRGRVILDCSQFHPPHSVRCTRECARRMDRRDQLQLELDDRERVLVLLAASHEPTARIADILAEYLKADDLVVDHATLGKGAPPPFADYDAAVIGAPAGLHGHGGRLADYVHAHAAELDAMPVFVFAVGHAGRRDPDAYLAHLTRQIGWRPAGTATVHDDVANPRPAIAEFARQIADDIPAALPQSG